MLCRDFRGGCEDARGGGFEVVHVEQERPGAWLNRHFRTFREVSVKKVDQVAGDGRRVCECLLDDARIFIQPGRNHIGTATQHERVRLFQG